MESSEVQQCCRSMRRRGGGAREVDGRHVGLCQEVCRVVLSSVVSYYIVSGCVVLCCGVWNRMEWAWAWSCVVVFEQARKPLGPPSSSSSSPFSLLTLAVASCLEINIDPLPLIVAVLENNPVLASTPALPRQIVVCCFPIASV